MIDLVGTEEVSTSLSVALTPDDWGDHVITVSGLDDGQAVAPSRTPSCCTLPTAPIRSMTT